MFKLRRRTTAEAAVTDQPFCAMCGTTTRVDAASGRCALGHRVLAPGALVAPAPLAADEPTAVLVASDAAAYEPTTELAQVDEYSEPAGSYAGEGLYEAYQSADAAGRAVTWDDVVAPTKDPGTTVYDDYLTWDQPAASGFSSLDVDTNELPVTEDEVVYDSPAAAAAPVKTTIDPSDLLDELDDETYARRRTAGTLGATVAVTGMLAAAIAILPI